jgi:hypothetical protein
MKPVPPLGLVGLLACVLVVILAAAARFGYLAICCDGGASASRFAVQGTGIRPELPTATTLRGQTPPSEIDSLAGNLQQYHWFGSLTPLSDVEERTAHVAPGYARLLAWSPDDATLRRFQAGLGVASVLLLFLYAWIAFASRGAAFVVGLLAAVDPFAIVNVAEFGDGTVATFLLAASLLLGIHAARSANPVTSLAFGLALAGLCLVRAAYLPFAFFGLAWFLLRCRTLRLGWFAGLLALLGFGNGLAPWMVRNYQAFQQPVPIVDSAWLDIWVGVMPGATGEAVDEKTLRESLPPERLRALLDEPNQAKRYEHLSHDVARRVQEDPAAALSGRLAAATRFLFGDALRSGGRFVATNPDGASSGISDGTMETAAALGLIALLALAFLGWRTSAVEDCGLAALALVLLPIPYLLSHAEKLSGPRLPWDAVLAVFAGHAIVRCFAGNRPVDDAEFQSRR